VPNYGFRAGRGWKSTEGRAILPESFVESFSIEAEQDDKVLLDFSNSSARIFLESANCFRAAGILSSVAVADPIPLTARIATSRLSRTSDQRLCRNRVQLCRTRRGRGGLAALLGGGGGATTADDRSMVIRVNYNMYMLPVNNGFQPRFFDPRVGYFTVDHQDFSDTTAIDQKQMFITRWHLVKKNPRLI
jgi:hypothetical protein